MADRGRSRSPPGKPVSARTGPLPDSHDRGDLLEQLEEALVELTQGATTVSVEVLQTVVPLVVLAAAFLHNAARADKLAILRAEGALEPPADSQEFAAENLDSAPSTPAGSCAGTCPSVAPTLPSPPPELNEGSEEEAHLRQDVTEVEASS